MVTHQTQNEPPRIDIDRELATAVRNAGGSEVADILSEPPRFENADYVFLDDHVVAELKRLEKDSTTDPALSEKLGRIYTKLMRQGRAPVVFGNVTVTLEQIAQFDERAAFELLEPQKQRLAKVLRKANKQIKETARHFDISGAKGLLFLANDGDLAFQMDMVFTLLDRLTRTGVIVKSCG